MRQELLVSESEPSRDEPAGGGPICKRCGLQHQAGSDRCWGCGAALAGNRLAWKHGAFGRSDRPELAQIRADAEAWTEEVRRSQGGPDLDRAPVRAGAVANLGGIEYVKRLLIEDLKQNGIYTRSKKGGPSRVRSSLPLLLKVLESWSHYARMLGLDPREHSIVVSPREWLESLQPNDEPEKEDRQDEHPDLADASGRPVEKETR